MAKYVLEQYASGMLVCVQEHSCFEQVALKIIHERNVDRYAELCLITMTEGGDEITRMTIL